MFFLRKGVWTVSFKTFKCIINAQLEVWVVNGMNRLFTPSNVKTTKTTVSFSAFKQRFVLIFDRDVKLLKSIKKSLHFVIFVQQFLVQIFISCLLWHYIIHFYFFTEMVVLCYTTATRPQGTDINIIEYGRIWQSSMSMIK